MNAITQVYEGDDLVISRFLLESLGLQPGDKVIIRPQLPSAAISSEERERRREILQRLTDAWSDEELADFEEQRVAMWQRRIDHSSQ